MKQVYTSGDLPKQPKVKGRNYREARGFVWSRAYIFEIRTGRHDANNNKIVVELHSSQTRRRTSTSYAHASTEIVLNQNEAEHLLAGLLAAMSEEGAST